MSIEPPLAVKVKVFLNGERLLFWLEAVSLLEMLSGSVATLECIANGNGAFFLTSYCEPIDADKSLCH